MKMSNVLSLPHTQGWEQCVCLDMNQFYLGLVPQPERQRVERGANHGEKGRGEKRKGWCDKGEERREREEKVEERRERWREG